MKPHTGGGRELRPALSQQNRFIAALPGISLHLSPRFSLDPDFLPKFYPNRLSHPGANHQIPCISGTSRVTYAARGRSLPSWSLGFDSRHPLSLFLAGQEHFSVCGQSLGRYRSEKLHVPTGLSARAHRGSRRRRGWPALQDPRAGLRRTSRCRPPGGCRESHVRVSRRRRSPARQ